MPSLKLKDLANLKVIIFGLGAEGLSTYQFLKKSYPKNNFLLVDDRPLTELNPIWQKLLAQNARTKFTNSLKKFTLDDLRDSVLFKTPGVPLAHPAIKQILNAGAVLSSNTQLFFDLIANYRHTHPTSQITTIGITGTKGKSTTSSMIYHLLKTNKFETYLGGNIGDAALENWQSWQKKLQKNKLNNEQSAPAAPVFFVLELSCHQLAELKSSPNIAVIQAISSEHLDYYENFEQYFQAKTQITRFQKKADLVIYNADSKTAPQLAKLSPSKKITFSLKDESLVALAKHNSLLGEHNLYNTLPAVLIGQQLHIPTAKIMRSIKSFKSLPHRLELIATINGVQYYDDSIATNPEATMAALRTFAGKPIVLLAGGYERQQDFAQLAQVIKHSQVKAIAILPPAGHRLIAELEKADICNTLRANIEEFSSMIEAVHHAHQHAKSGDVVLLSPAAASFGMFKNYQERGNEFTRVAKLFAN